MRRSWCLPRVSSKNSLRPTGTAPAQSLARAELSGVEVGMDRSAVTIFPAPLLVENDEQHDEDASVEEPAASFPISQSLSVSTTQSTTGDGDGSRYEALDPAAITRSKKETVDSAVGDGKE
ncbi:hypothetical protein PIB30_075717 [Stylosanthes scabra]|uniref:Uncharacterized protein n=1 Tax=Stylosanthes scabra TaxID=79078 RepID=A0ABU6TS83_9FABA|nr:hypothetical protein [Stylosanthes scabra]